MTKADLDIRDQVAFEREGKTLVGRVSTLGDRTAAVEVWNVGTFEVAYAKLSLRKKKSRRKSPSKATRALREQTGSATAVAKKVPGERAAKKAAKKPGKRKAAEPKTSNVVKALMAQGYSQDDAVRIEDALRKQAAADEAAAAEPAAPKKGQTAAKRPGKTAAATKPASRKGRRGLTPQGPAEMQERIGGVLNKLFIRKPDDRAAVTAIAEKLIADQHGFSESAIQEASIVHFGERKDAPKWIRKLDKATVRKFRKKYTVRGDKVMTKADVVRAGGRVKLPPFRPGQKFADYTLQHWGGIEHFVYVLWPEVNLNTAQEKAAFRSLDLQEAEKFITRFEKAFNNKITVHTTASAFGKALEKTPKAAQREAIEVGESARSKSHRLSMIAESAEAIQNPACAARGRYAIVITERGRSVCTFATDNRSLAYRAAKRMVAKGRNAFVADQGLRRNPASRKGIEAFGRVVLVRDAIRGELKRRSIKKWPYALLGHYQGRIVEVPAESEGAAFLLFPAAIKLGLDDSVVYDRRARREVTGYQSNPPRKRKGRRKATRPVNRRKIRKGQAVEWTDRYGKRDYGFVYTAGAQVSTIVSALTHKFGAQANRNLYPVK